MATKKKAAAKKVTAPAAETMPAAKGLYGEISAFTTVIAKKDEKAGDYAARVCQVISEMSDDDFGKLSKGAQDWFDKAVESINAGTLDDVVALSGFPSAKETADPAPAPAPTKAKKGAKKGGNAKGKKVPAEKKAGKKKAAKAQGTLPGVAEGGKGRVDGVAYRMRLQVVKNPDIGFEDAVKAAGAKGSKIKAERGNNAWNAFFNAVQVMRIAKAEGVLKARAY